MDEAHKAVDAEIKELAKRINAEYRESAKRVTEQLKRGLREYERDRRAKSAEYSERMSRLNDQDEKDALAAEFQAWRDAALAEATAREDLLARINYEILDADRLAREIVAGRTGEVFTANVAWGTWQIERGIGSTCTAWTLYDQDTVARLLSENPDLYPVPDLDVQKAWRWNAQRLQSTITQAAVSGASVDDIAKDLRRVMAMNVRDSIRVARTAMTGAENAGRVNAYKQAQAMGIELGQVWIATLDGRTRPSHRELDGESVPVNSTFSNGCRFPGDPSGPASEVMNCRCTLIANLRGFERDVSTLDGRWSRLPDGMTYDQWKKMKGEQNGWGHED